MNQFEELPAHASPIISPQTEYEYPKLSPEGIQNAQSTAPPPIVSPAPGYDSHDLRGLHSVPVDTSKSVNGLATPSLLPTLPTVTCNVRARIPTTTGTDMWLHVYSNDVDNKDHIAIVFGENSYIRSRSLFAERPGDTEQDRMNRGAYEGKLYPGRTSSRAETVKNESKVDSGRGSPIMQAMHKRHSAQKLAALQGPTPGAAVAYPSNAATANGGDHDFPGFDDGLPPQSHPTSSVDSEDSRSDESSELSDTQHVHQEQAPLVRIHSECYTGETVWSARCDCGEQLDEAARLMSTPSDPSSPTTSSGGVIVYLRQEGRGIGLPEKLKAYNLQDLGYDTFEANLMLRHPADARSYGLATAMLVDLGLGGCRGIRLLTNNPDKIRAVEGPNREIVVKERVAMVPLAWSTHGERGVKGTEVEGYLSTKIAKFGHMLSR